MNEPIEARLERLEAELAALKITMVAAVQQAAQQPRRVGTEELMHVLSADRSRLGAIAERLDEVVGLIVNQRELTDEIMSILREIRGGGPAA